MRPPHRPPSAGPRLARLLAALAVTLVATLGLVACSTGSGGGDQSPAASASIQLGRHYDDIVTAHPDFPGQSEGRVEDGLTVLTYADTDYGFDRDGLLREIRAAGSGSARGDDGGDDEGGGASGAEEAAPAEAPGSPSEDAPAQSSRKQGDTSIVTMRPFQADGSPHPDYKQRRIEVRNHVCAPLGDDLYKCGPPNTDATLSHCKVTGDTAWCLSLTTLDTPEFIHLTSVETTSTPAYDSRPKTGPVPVFAWIDYMRKCGLATYFGESPAGASPHYSCPQGVWLWAPDGEAVFTTDGGTWTAKAGTKGPSETVELDAVIFLE